MIIRCAAADIDGGKKNSGNIIMTTKEIVILLFLALGISTTKAQNWTKADSVKLNKLLRDNKEIKINRHELQNIQFGAKIINNPLLEPMQLNNISPDETLPDNAAKKYQLTMQPYKPTTPYNWDPIFHCKIVEVNGRWEPVHGPEKYINMLRVASLAANMGSIIAARKGEQGLALGNKGAWVNGGTIGGLDLMYFFEKRFWDFKQNAIRKKTLDLLKGYNAIKFNKIDVDGSSMQIDKGLKTIQ